MAFENLYLDAWLVNNGIVSPGNAIGDFADTWTANVDNAAGDGVASFSDPSGNNAIGNHTFTARVRKDVGNNNPTFLLEVLDASDNVLKSSGSTTITSLSSQTISVTVTAGALNTAGLTGIKVRLTAPSTGGSPSARSVAQLDYVLWSGDFSTVEPPSGPSVYIFNGVSEVPATVTIWDDILELPATIELV